MIKKYKNIIFDFDGVLKDSLDAKGLSFQKLFMQKDENLKKKILEHHNNHGGISRFEKIPLYLKWANEKITEELILEYLDMFAKIVITEVVNSKWVDGICEFLEKNRFKQNFFIVTATPEDEIINITKKTGIHKQFRDIKGSPKSKDFLVKKIINNNNLKKKETVLIGDSITDINAAIKCGIEFKIRLHKHNKILAEKYRSVCFENFYDIIFK